MTARAWTSNTGYNFSIRGGGRPSKRKQWPFWVVYADVMTCLFAVMLALFVLAYWWLNQRRVVSEAKLKQIEEIDKALASLSNGGMFIYQPTFKRYLFRQEVQFARGSFQIPERDESELLDAGRQVQSLMNDLEMKHFENIKYLIVIEGTASNDGFSHNFELSYERALALHHLWDQAGIIIDSDICEVAISGSGTGGLGRFGQDSETKNQRFFIQIVPKIGAELWHGGSNGRTVETIAQTSPSITRNSQKQLSADKPSERLEQPKRLNVGNSGVHRRHAKRRKRHLALSSAQP